MTPNASAPAVAVAMPVGAAPVGWVADRWGLTVSLLISALMPLLGFVIALFLPEPRAR